MKTEHHRSAGGLVIHGPLILLISTQGGRRWQLPKGHIEAGETAEEAAVREVREETGVTGRIVDSLPGVEYWYVERGPRRVHKQVDYYLLEYVSGDTADFDPREVSSAEWFTWEAGLAKMSFENERKVVEQARRIVDPQGAAAAAAAAVADAADAANTANAANASGIADIADIANTADIEPANPALER